MHNSISYHGYTKLDEEQSAKFYQNTLDLDFYENQYIIAGNDDLYKYKNGNTHRVNFQTINNNWEGQIKPLDTEQLALIDMLGDRDSKVKVVRGVYGSGKDYLMFNKALSLVDSGEFDKIIFVRPNVTVANVPAIGFLPDGIDQKLAWTLAPLYDKVGGKEGVDQLIGRHKLEMVPLLFIRGRSFENSIIYVTEAQNIDSEIAKLILGRIGDNSELWLNGDNHQTDNRIFDKDNGLTKMVDRLKGNSLFSYVYLPNTHRSNVANLANLLDDEDII